MSRVREHPAAKPAAAGSGPRQRERSNLWLLRLMRGIALTARAPRLALAAAPDHAVLPAGRRASVGAIRARYLGARARAPSTAARRLPSYPLLRGDGPRPRVFPAGTLRRVRLARDGRRAISTTPLPHGRRRAAGRRAPRQLRGVARARPATRLARRDGHVRRQRQVHQRDAGRDRAEGEPARDRARPAQRDAVVARLARRRRHRRHARPIARCRASRSAARTLWLPFLGTPARFSDGPFRLAALLRRPVVFMAGLYHGGRRYELRFVELDDFSDRPAGAAQNSMRASAT